MTDSPQIGSKDAACLLGVTQTTINRWVKSGRLRPAVVFPGYKGARLFDVADVEALAESPTAEHSDLAESVK